MAGPSNSSTPASTFGLPFGPQLLSLFPFGDLYLDGLFVAAATAEPLVPPIGLAALDSAFASLPDFDLE